MQFNVACRTRRNALSRNMNGLQEHIHKHSSSDTAPAIGYRKETDLHWFVMRDLKRSNAKLPAYQMLGRMGIKVFTPMVWKMVVRHGKHIPQEVPFMQDLLFVYESYKVLYPIVERTSTLQFRFLRDGKRTPMTVRDADMDRFIKAVEATENPCFYSPQDIKPSMVGKYVRIIGGLLNGYEGRLQKLQGSRIKRLFVELPNLLTAAVEVQPEFIQIMKN